MASSSTSANPLAVAVKHGETLKILKKRVKHKDSSKGERENIYEEVENVVMELLEAFNKEQDQLALFPEESIARFLKKIRETLEDFGKVNPVNKPKYEKLIGKVNDFKLGVVESSQVASSSHLADDHLQESYDESSMDEFTFDGLTDEEEVSLTWFTLFPSGAEIKKRELINWWIATELIQNLEEGNKMLANLVANGFILPAIGNRKISKKYKINNISIWKMRKGWASSTIMRQKGSWKVMKTKSHSSLTKQKSWQQPQIVIEKKSGVYESASMEALINIDDDNLSTSTFQGFSKMSYFEVLHFGSWRPDPKNYIVAENIEIFNGINNLERVRHVSFQGMSGVHELPEMVYQLKSLKVLDLRCCHNLALLSREISSLKQLIHLDLSECYLLDRIPREITSLPLQVLKGFIVNPDSIVGRAANQASSCEFRELSKLKSLVKLSLRTRRMNFPTVEDLSTLCELEKLTSLRVAWAGSSNDCQLYGGIGSSFPKQLQKLELQAAPEGTASRVLALISTVGVSSLEKLYIRGGGLSDLSPERHCLLYVKILRLRYLPQLHVDWDEFRKSFPGLIRLETFGCPNLLFFPCDRYGVWEST